MILSRWLLLDDRHDVPFESNATLRVHARHSGSPHLTAFHTAGWDASPTSDLASSKSLCSCVAVAHVCKKYSSRWGNTVQPSVQGLAERSEGSRVPVQTGVF